MNFKNQMRKYDKKLAKMKIDLDKYTEIVNQNFDDISYDDMLFRMKYDTISNPVKEFQKHIPNELKKEIIDSDLLAIQNKYSNDRSVSDMLKILQMIRITEFRVKRFLEIGKRYGADKDDPTYESYGAVKFLIYWSAYAPIRDIINKYNSLDDIFKTSFHKSIYDKFVKETYQARKNFQEVSDRLRIIAMKQSEYKMDQMRKEQRRIEEQMENFRGRF